MIRKIKMFILAASGVLIFLILASCTVLHQPKFGKLPEGERLRKAEQSPNYKNGQFTNTVETPLFTENTGTLGILWDSLFNKPERLRPEGSIPVVITDLSSLDTAEDTIIWLGHSSWYIQMGGKRILIDPVLSSYASPFSFFNKAFKGTDIYSSEDMPEIDYLLISHDHWDHLDFPTVKALMPKVKHVICPLGIGASFEDWGYSREKIYEADWNDKVAIEEGISFYILTARHYSGRMFSRNKTLWAAFAIETPDKKIFYSGDSGYGTHFKEIGDTFDGFDMVMLDSGQYDKRWAYIHMTPEEAAQAAEDLNAKAFIPAHVGRFCISNHSWDEPFKHLTKSVGSRPYQLVLPRIGEPVSLTENRPPQAHWWEGIN